jgi:hypothetical protein
MTFDTHTFYTRLKNVGFSEQQADAIAEIQKETATAAIEQTKHDFHLDELATVRDIKELELTFSARIKETELKIELVRADLKRDLAESKAELSRTILTVGIGVGLTQLVAIFGLFMRMTGKL